MRLATVRAASQTVQDSRGQPSAQLDLLAQLAARVFLKTMNSDTYRHGAASQIQIEPAEQRHEPRLDICAQ
jgi:hypothetical protein